MGRSARMPTTASAISSRVRRFSAPKGCGHADLGEHPTATGLRSERREPRIRAVHRDAKTQRDVPFQFGRVVRHQVRARPVGDQGRDPGEQAGPLEQLLAQRPRGGVVDRDQRQPSPRMARDTPGKQGQVVLDDLRCDRHRRHVDHPQPRLAQEHEQEQEAAPRMPGSGFRSTPTARSRVIEGTTTTDSSSWLSRIASQTSPCAPADRRSGDTAPPRTRRRARRWPRPEPSRGRRS